MGANNLSFFPKTKCKQDASLLIDRVSKTGYEKNIERFEIIERVVRTQDQAVWTPHGLILDTDYNTVDTAMVLKQCFEWPMNIEQMKQEVIS